MCTSPPNGQMLSKMSFEIKQTHPSSFYQFRISQIELDVSDQAIVDKHGLNYVPLFYFILRQKPLISGVLYNSLNYRSLLVCMQNTRNCIYAANKKLLQHSSTVDLFVK